MEVADLQALSRIVHERGIPLIVDTTLIPFTEFDSHSLGVDIEAERQGFEPITLTAYMSATLLSKFQIVNETVTIFIVKPVQL